LHLSIFEQPGLNPPGSLEKLDRRIFPFSQFFSNCLFCNNILTGCQIENARCHAAVDVVNFIN